MSESKDSPNYVQSSLGARTAIKTALALSHVSLEPNELNKGSHDSLDKMSYLSHKREKRMAYVTTSGQVAEMVKCFRPSQTDVIFVAMDALTQSLCRRLHCQKACDSQVVFLSLLLLGLINEGQLTNGHKNRIVPG